MKKIYLQPLTEVHQIRGVESLMVNSVAQVTGAITDVNNNPDDAPEEGDVKEFIFEEDIWEEEQEGFYYEY